MKNRRRLLAAAAALCALVVAAPQMTLAEPPAAAAKLVIDESAMALLKKVQMTMLGLRTYRAECWTTLTYDAPGKDGKPRPPRREMATLTAVKPNLMRYDAWRMTASGPGGAWKTWQRQSQSPSRTFVSDGKTAWWQFGTKYHKDTRTAPQYLSTILEPWTGFYSTHTSPYDETVHYRTEGELLEVRRAGREVVDGTPCDKVFVHVKTSYSDEAMEERTTWFIAGDGLVRRRVQHVRFGDKPGHTRDATLRNIRVNAPVRSRATLFAYKPPKGVKSEAQSAREEPPLLANGTPAPDFTATDKNGTPVKLSDHRGKVVVLDFWASWCGPCVASMPHNQTVMKKLQAENLPVVLLALDNSETREPFLAWINKRPELDAITFAHADSKTADIAGKLYNVSGIPTQYVIDANGVIRAAFVGYGGPTDALEKAVRAALAGQGK